MNLVHGLDITVDDTDTNAISYRDGFWSPNRYQLNRLDYGGSHTVSTDTNATATFTFTGAPDFEMCISRIN